MSYEDLSILSESLGSEREKVKNLQEEIEKRDKIIKRLKWKLAGHGLFWVILTLGILAGGGWLLFLNLTGETTDTCYIESEKKSVTVYTVNRVREWGNDPEIGYSPDLDKAREIARKQGCRLPNVRAER